MPKHCSRAQILRALNKENLKRATAATVWHTMEDSSEDNSDNRFIHDCVDMRLQNAEKAILSKRWLFCNDTHGS